MQTQPEPRKSLRKQEEAIAALLTYPTVEAAASAIGISSDTLNRWQHDEEFAEAYSEARHEVVQQATTTLSSTCGAAVKTLSEVMTSPGSPAYSRIYAAKIVLDYAYRGLELFELSTRLAALERNDYDE